MKIVCITENTSADERLCAEHGLSLYIETEKHKILFDMGQTDAFCENAEKLGVRLEDVDIAVLSHGHYDHGGGLSRFLQVNKKAPVYISRYAFGEYYNGQEKYIGLDISLKDSERLIFTDGEKDLGGGMCLYSHNDKKRPNYMGSFGLNKRCDGEFVPDDFIHEQYLLIEENGKRVLISGCSHKGVVDIVSWFSPDVFVGGFHFSKIEDTKMLDTALEKLLCGNTVYYTCHCTGITQYEYMRAKSERIHYICCGDTIKI